MVRIVGGVGEDGKTKYQVRGRELERLEWAGACAGFSMCLGVLCLERRAFLVVSCARAMYWGRDCCGMVGLRI